MLKKGKSLVYKGISDAFFDAGNGKFGLAKKRMHILDVHIDLSLKTSKGYDRIFLVRSKESIKSLREIL